MGSVMVSSSQIREHLSMLLDSQVDLESFEDWFVKNTWNIHLGGSVAAESLTFAIEESLSEYSSRHINEQILLQELSQVLSSENMVFRVEDVPRVAYSFRYSDPLLLGYSQPSRLVPVTV
jgi:hypothetical protein